MTVDQMEYLSLDISLDIFFPCIWLFFVLLLLFIYTLYFFIYLRTTICVTQWFKHCGIVQVAHSYKHSYSGIFYNLKLIKYIFCFSWLTKCALKRLWDWLCWHGNHFYQVRRLLCYVICIPHVKLWFIFLVLIIVSLHCVPVISL